MSDAFLNIKISILSICKNNNGYFKSEKQAKYLISELTKWGGHFGSNNSGYHTCPLSATWDADGIIKTTKSTKNGRVTVWERRVQGVLTETDKKLLKKRNRKLKELNKQLASREACVVTVDYARIEEEQKKLDEYNEFINKPNVLSDEFNQTVKDEAEKTQRIIERLKREPARFEENTQKLRDRILHLEELIKDIESTEFSMKENK
jgi:hypothetical protein